MIKHGWRLKSAFKGLNMAEQLYSRSASNHCEV